MHLYVIFFQPSLKVIDKTRDGATTVKRYSQPTTPCDRLIQHDVTGNEVKAALDEYRTRLDPMSLLHTIRETQSALVAATAPEIRETQAGESLEVGQFQVGDQDNNPMVGQFPGPRQRKRVKSSSALTLPTSGPYRQRFSLPGATH